MADVKQGDLYYQDLVAHGCIEEGLEVDPEGNLEVGLEEYLEMDYEDDKSDEESDRGEDIGETSKEEVANLKQQFFATEAEQREYVITREMSELAELLEQHCGI
ncbi:unnamed protein product [Lactuca saligna]|uniref:Uncharacterized protein n=1 Tax=Lactuca saligna TaxID=75948 RepID=A0AA36E8I1_LACSI|nr:unnamed protein product [Lactuca saligna]